MLTYVIISYKHTHKINLNKKVDFQDFEKIQRSFIYLEFNFKFDWKCIYISFKSDPGLNILIFNLFNSLQV